MTIFSNYLSSSGIRFLPEEQRTNSLQNIFFFFKENRQWKMSGTYMSVYFGAVFVKITVAFFVCLWMKGIRLNRKTDDRLTNKI